VIVVDANVVIHLLTGSGDKTEGGTLRPGVRAAELYDSDPEWVAPIILMSEVRNVLVTLSRRGHLERADAKPMMEDARALFAGRVATSPDHEILETALELDLSAYDAEYLVLARALGIPLVTADARLLRADPAVARPL
jgi:predicted nucleic acid-binding protein